MDAILIDYGITAKKTVKMEIFVIFCLLYIKRGNCDNEGNIDNNTHVLYPFYRSYSSKTVICNKK